MTYKVPRSKRLSLPYYSCKTNTYFTYILKDKSSKYIQINSLVTRDREVPRFLHNN